MPAPIPDLTRTPRPGRSDFLPPLAGPSGSGFFGDRRVWRTMNGRNALYLALEALGLGPGDTVLLPAYHCTAMVDPILAYGAKAAYYPVARDLSVAPGEVEACLRETRASAVVAVHLFGRAAPMRELRGICERAGARLIEDCCHSLFGSIGGAAMGSFGHASVFSFRKTLSVVDGGALVLPRDADGPRSRPRAFRPWKFQARMAKWTWDAARSGPFLPLPATAPSSATGPGASGPGASPAVPVPNAAGTERSHAAAGPDSQEDADFLPECLGFPMSLVSRWILGCARGADIRGRRRANYRRLAGMLEGIPGVTLFPEAGAEDCPLGLPFLAPPAPFRWDYRLRGQGVPAFSFGETLHASLDAARFPDALFLSRNLVILPVHQALGPGVLEAMARRVRETFAADAAGRGKA